MASGKEKIPKTNNIEVVVTEPAPLDVLPDFDKFVGAGGQVNGYGNMVLLMIWGIRQAIIAPKLQQEAKNKKTTYNSILLEGGDWTPAKVLFNKVSESVNGRGGVYDAAVGEVPVNNMAVKSKPDEYLLVEMSNYSLKGENLSILIQVKLVDGKSGNVIRKSKRFGAIDIGSEELAFSNNAEIFKDKFSEVSYSLLEKNLKHLKISR